MSFDVDGEGGAALNVLGDHLLSNGGPILGREMLIVLGLSRMRMMIEWGEDERENEDEYYYAGEDDKMRMSLR